MSESPQDPSGTPGEEPAERVGDSLRAAVERTLAATAAPAAETRQRAQELLDQVVRRSRSARDEATRRGEAARDEVARRGEAARDEVVRRGEQAGERIADVIADLRPADRDALEMIGERMSALEQRLEGLERLLRSRGGDSNPQPEDEERPSGADSGAG